MTEEKKPIKVIFAPGAFDDFDGSAIDAIKNLKQEYPNEMIIFANGGDRTQLNIPEMKCANPLKGRNLSSPHFLNESLNPWNIDP